MSVSQSPPATFLDDRLTPETLTERAHLIAAACRQWQAADCSERLRAIEHRVSAGLDPDRVGSQLMRIADWDSEMLLALVRRELGEDLTTAMSPSCVLHLASGSVPGLSIDSVIPTLMLGSNHLVRCGAGDTEFPEFLDHLRRSTPALARMITQIDTVDWSEPDAAVVWGTDSTIALVRHKLGQSAPVAAFGERTSVAIIELSSAISADLHTRILDGLERDRRMFNGAGCMTPAHVFVVSQNSDDTVVETRLATIDVEWTVVRTLSELETKLLSIDGALQTAVIGAGEDKWPTIAQIAVRSGATRVCLPGTAHHPPLDSSHDGRGRLRDLVRWVTAG